MTSCPSSDGVTIATDASPGYVSNTLYDAYSSLGWYSCPWLIRASPGQRIQLTLLTLQASIMLNNLVFKTLISFFLNLLRLRLLSFGFNNAVNFNQ